MASDDLIDTYLADLRARVGTWHRHPDDVAAEANDHLLARIEVLEAGGLAHDAAAERAIAEYGSVEQVASAHLRTARRPAIPTAGTRTAGLLAIIGGIGWVTLPILTSTLPNDGTLVFLALAQVFHLSVGCTVAAGIGLWLRHGGLGRLAIAAAVPALLAGPFVLFVWPVPAWLVLLGAASLLFGLSMIVRGVPPRWSTWCVTGGLAASGTAVLVAEFVAPSTTEDFAFLEGHLWIAVVIAGMVVFGAGLIGVGRRLRAETPVAITPAPVGSPG